MSACSDKDDDNYRFPLKVGNSWTMLYTLEYYDVHAEAMATEIDTIYIEVAEQIESPNGELCYRVEHWTTADPNHTIGYDILVNREDGLYQLGWKLSYGLGPFKGAKPPFHSTPFGFGIRDTSPKFEEVWLTTPKKLLPSKCEEGLSWTYGPNSNHLEAGYWIMPRESVTVPQGTYKCYVRKTNILEMENPIDLFNYYAKEGPIKFYYETIILYTDEEVFEPLGEFPLKEKMELMSSNLQ